MKKQIVTNLTLKTYEKKYKNHKKHLLSFTKNEVDTLDKQAGTIGENYVLRKRRWALIGDTYYELPKPYRKMWFRGLTAAGKMWACIIPIGVVGALGGAGYGVYCLIGGGIKVAGDFAKYVKISKTEYDKDGNYAISFNVSSGKRIRSIPSVTINSNSLNITNSFDNCEGNEFMFIDHKVVISKLTMQKQKGRIVIEPETCGINEYKREDIYTDNSEYVSHTVNDEGNLEVVIKVETGSLSGCTVLIGPSKLTKDTDFTFNEINNVGDIQYKIVISKPALTAHSGEIGIIGIKNE